LNSAGQAIKKATLSPPNPPQSPPPQSEHEVTQSPHIGPGQSPRRFSVENGHSFMLQERRRSETEVVPPGYAPPTAEILLEQPLSGHVRAYSEANIPRSPSHTKSSDPLPGSFGNSYGTTERSPKKPHTLTSPLSSPTHQKKAQSSKSEQLRKAELDTILDCTFGAIEEIFHLTTPNNWIRHQGLHFVKTILRRAYGSSISKMIQTKLTDFTAEENVALYLDTVRENIWPDEPIPDRTESEREATRMEAKTRLLHPAADSMLGNGLDKMQTIVGRYNTVLGTSRLFQMLQDPILNQLLVFNLLEILLQISLEEQPH
jgi:hypothetical protein